MSDRKASGRGGGTLSMSWVNMTYSNISVFVKALLSGLTVLPLPVAKEMPSLL